MQYEKLKVIRGGDVTSCEEDVRRIGGQIQDIADNIRSKTLKWQLTRLERHLFGKALATPLPESTDDPAREKWERHIELIEDDIARIREEIGSLIPNEEDTSGKRKTRIPRGLSKGLRMAKLRLKRAQEEYSTAKTKQATPKTQGEATKNQKKQRWERDDETRREEREDDPYKNYADGETVDEIRDSYGWPAFTIQIYKKRKNDPPRFSPVGNKDNRGTDYSSDPINWEFFDSVKDARVAIYEVLEEKGNYKRRERSVQSVPPSSEQRGSEIPLRQLFKGMR